MKSEESVYDELSPKLAKTASMTSPKDLMDSWRY
jgi:hypothetical protein